MDLFRKLLPKALLLAFVASGLSASTSTWIRDSQGVALLFILLVSFFGAAFWTDITERNHKSQATITALQNENRRLNDLAEADKG